LNVAFDFALAATVTISKQKTLFQMDKKKLKAVIVDDEKNACELISAILADKCPEIEVVSSLNSAFEAIQEINRVNPDLVFLDIEMPFASGFDVLEAIPERDFDVIFVTAFNQYAIKAFKFSAAEYLLKPLDEKEIVTAVRKIVAKRSVSREKDERIDLLLKSIQNEKPKKIALYLNENIEFINLDKIVRFEADTRYTYIYFSLGSRQLVTKNIGEFEDLLCDKGFFRVHKSHIVNMEFVKSISKKEGAYLTLQDGTKITVSRRKLDDFVNEMKNYIE
jgi:two-component system, LytTR family, response regulator